MAGRPACVNIDKFREQEIANRRTSFAFPDASPAARGRATVH
jgi:hypothetical protein